MGRTTRWMRRPTADRYIDPFGLLHHRGRLYHLHRLWRWRLHRLWLRLGWFRLDRRRADQGDIGGIRLRFGLGRQEVFILALAGRASGVGVGNPTLVVPALVHGAVAIIGRLPKRRPHQERKQQRQQKKKTHLTSSVTQHMGWNGIFV